LWKIIRRNWKNQGWNWK